MADPSWRRGRYYGRAFPHAGLKVAREIGTISYRSGPEWEERFGRRRAAEGVPTLTEDFLVETYLAHQGEKFCLQYDPNSYLYVSKAMDLFDLGDGAPSREAGVARVKCPTLVIGVASDMLFPVWQQRELAEMLRRAGTEVTHVQGRDASGAIVQVQISPDGTPGVNPAFDVTPAHLVTGLITERGVCAASAAGLAALFPERAGQLPRTSVHQILPPSS